MNSAAVGKPPSLFRSKLVFRASSPMNVKIKGDGREVFRVFYLETQLIFHCAEYKDFS